MEERPIRSIIGEQKPISAGAETSVAAAAKLMKRHRIGALLVTKSGRLAGIFTERDRPFGHALHLMYEGEFRHVPVVENGQPLGMVSARDALGPDLQQFVADLGTRNH